MSPGPPPGARVAGTVNEGTMRGLMHRTRGAVCVLISVVIGLSLIGSHKGLEAFELFKGKNEILMLIKRGENTFFVVVQKG